MPLKNAIEATASAERSARPPAAMWAAVGVILLAFCKPLLDTAQLAMSSQVYSYLALMPFITAYLLYTNKQEWVFCAKPNIRRALLPSLAGMCLGGAFLFGVRSGWDLHRDNYLAITTLAMLCLLFAAFAAFASQETLRKSAYPITLLVFMAPFPTIVLHGLESLLQHLSADVAHGMLAMTGMPLVRTGTQFRLPGITIEVAPECSGIRSTLALFITSLVAGYVLLRSPWRRVALSAAILPLALLRNGFRIWTISQLCVNVNPDMIHSYIHHKGGPIFFALSLVPFSLFLYWLIKFERKATKRQQTLVQQTGVGSV